MTDERRMSKVWKSRALYENAHKVAILRHVHTLVESDLDAEGLRSELRDILWESAERDLELGDGSD